MSLRLVSRRKLALCALERDSSALQTVAVSSSCDCDCELDWDASGGAMSNYELREGWRWMPGRLGVGGGKDSKGIVEENHGERETNTLGRFQNVPKGVARGTTPWVRVLSCHFRRNHDDMDNKLYN